MPLSSGSGPQLRAQKKTELWGSLPDAASYLSDILFLGIRRKGIFIKAAVSTHDEDPPQS